MLVVGSILNLINQPAALLGNEPIEWSSLLLTYTVPFLVSLISGGLALKECHDEKAT